MLLASFLEDMDPDDLKEFLTPEQWEEYQANLAAKGKVLVKGLPLIPEVSEARIQGDWSCPKMAAKRYGGKRAKRRKRH
jgi:hypothetical protein